MAFVKWLARRREKPLLSTSRFAASQHVVMTSHGARTVLMDVRNNRYWGLDEVGSRIWQLVGQLTLGEIVAQLATEYEAPVDRLQRDVEEFIVAMRKADVLREVA